MYARRRRNLATMHNNRGSFNITTITNTTINTIRNTTTTGIGWLTSTNWRRLRTEEEVVSSSRSHVSISMRHPKFILCAVSVLLGIGFVVFICTLGLSGSSKVPRPLPAEGSPKDNYTIALHRALRYFDGQQSRRLQDGYPAVDHGLVGGYYDGRGQTKSNFPMAFSMTMLSWSVIEYGHKYKDISEYDHIRKLIRWGTDYLLLTFDNSASSITFIYSEVGLSLNQRTVLVSKKGSDLAGEMAAALASAAIVFRDDAEYAKKLLHGAGILFEFTHQRPGLYSQPLVYSEIYNSTGFYDELLWSSTWLFYASGNLSYLHTTTDERLATRAEVFSKSRHLRLLDWDNKLPAAELALTRLRMYLSPGYPYEAMLSKYHQSTDLNMCSYLPEFGVFNLTKESMYAATSAFLASMYADYMDECNAPGWYCGSTFIPLGRLRAFATTQVSYLLKHNFTNPTLVEYAGYIAALISVTNSGGVGVDKNTIFPLMDSLYPASPPPPSPWKPNP